MTHIFKVNQFSEHLINKVVSTCIDKNNTSSLSENNDTLYFMTPYLPISNFAQEKLIKTYCNNLKVKLVYSSFKIKNLVRVKDIVPRSLRSCVVYKFTCAECISVYVGETSRHISTLVREHLFSNKNYHVSKHLQSSDARKNVCSETCFKDTDSARTYYQLKIKAALHIMLEGTRLNKER